MRVVVEDTTHMLHKTGQNFATNWANVAETDVAVLQSLLSRKRHESGSTPLHLCVPGDVVNVSGAVANVDAAVAVSWVGVIVRSGVVVNERATGSHNRMHVDRVYWAS